MSYLDDLLSGKPLAPARPATPGVRPTQAKPGIPSRPLTPGAVNNAIKRKAPSDLAQTYTKNLRLDGTNGGNSNASNRPTSSNGPKPLPSNGSNGLTKARTPGTTQAATSKPAAILPSKLPSKGSFAEIMARAQNLKTSAKDFRYVHKKSEKKPKEAAKDSKKKDAQGKDGSKLKTTDKEVKGQRKESNKDLKDQKPVRVRSEITYKGTERPVPGSEYKGTAGLKSASKAGVPSRKDSSKQQDRHSRYTYYSDEEEEDDYYSDASSDMEAGAFDLEQEEARALREAKLEDERERRQEEELKHMKLARKQGRLV